MKTLREMREQQQCAFRQVKLLSDVMLQTCAECAPHVGTKSAGRTTHTSPDVTETSHDFQAVKANLEKFGDVEVFSDTVPQECMDCRQPIASACRVRLRG